MAAKGTLNGIDNRDLIIKTAKKLFLKRGAQRTSLADIAKEAGISKGTLYYYYSTKRDLIFDITEQHMDSITSSLINWVDSIHSAIEPAEIIEHVYKTIIGAEPRSRLHLYLIQEAISDSPQIQKKFKKTYRQWHGMLVSGLEKILPKRKHSDIPVIAELFLTSITGSIVQHQIGNKKLPFIEMSRLLIR